MTAHLIQRFLLRPVFWCYLGVTAASATLVTALPPALDIVDAPGTVQPPAETAAVPAGRRSARERARFNCDDCGVVESITRLEPAGPQPRGYEFTVRLRDGSSRMSLLTSADTWRVGDTIMLMGGQAAASK